ncbi:RNA polymerase II subunit A C-terminal domain phosphatase SSU72 [Porphyridium purpureum]|uniref:RNA polymerase II subunit A C-terminal domain phosphatase SSU72 n=1 Tax=Porphyridium purpureum TaxID=35688 RepID=A0A5J4YYE0_PORPP|nr:RNA polymerase II subunit A C-terminal domain phosphatase SSU72 [Porphyridium purpureum]|eukprot:POR2253..scf209_3
MLRRPSAKTITGRTGFLINLTKCPPAENCVGCLRRRVLVFVFVSSCAMPKYQRRFSTVCASNQNRSMAAHLALLEAGFAHVQSYGTGRTVKLPGPSVDKPNEYAFGTPYNVMYEDLKAQNEALYQQNGVLRMLDRNRNLKKGPERWQENFLRHDIVVTFEDRVFNAVLDDFATKRQPTLYEPVYIINLEVKDTHEQAQSGARLAVDLCELLDEVQDLDEEIESILEIFEEQSNQSLCYLPQYY